MKGDSMRIVSWNCSGKFREKFKKIQELDADIYVIQECEDPQKYEKTDYGRFARNYIWTGENRSRGLGLFAKQEILIEDHHWDSYCLRNFISARINGRFDLIGVWACDPYIKEYYVFQCIHINKFTDETVIIGDFNSNKIWDKKNAVRSHMNVVRALEEKNLVSAYHSVYHENQGEETHPTFYMRRCAGQGYHIDYCFIQEGRIKEYRILQAEEWLKDSDHLPLMLEIWE